MGHGFVSAALSQNIGGARILNPEHVSLAVIVTNAILQGSISELTGGKFVNGAMSAAFRVAFNDSLTKEEPLDHKLTVVVHLDDESDKVGHAFVILENSEGERIARGFWPGPRDGKYASIIYGASFPGVVLDEVDTGYLDWYDEWIETGVDPSGGLFAHRTYDITSKQYGAANNVVNNWTKRYRLNCMCGTFANQVLQSTGNSLFKNNNLRHKRPPSTRPIGIYKFLEDN